MTPQTSLLIRGETVHLTDRGDDDEYKVIVKGDESNTVFMNL